MSGSTSQRRCRAGSTDDSTSLCLLQEHPRLSFPGTPLSSHNLIHPAPPAPPLDSISTSAVRTVQDSCHPCAVSHTLVFLLCWNDKLFSGLLSGVRKVPCLPSVCLNPTGSSTRQGTWPCTIRIYELILLFYYMAKRDQDPKREEFWTSSLSFLINRMKIMTQWFTKLLLLFFKHNNLTSLPPTWNILSKAPVGKRSLQGLSCKFPFPMATC